MAADDRVRSGELSGNDSDGDDWIEAPYEEAMLAADLLGSKSRLDPKENIARAASVSGCDLEDFLKKLDVFDRIRFINACRSTVQESGSDETMAAGVVRAMVADPSSFCGNDQYMKPVIQDDPMLQFVTELDDGDEDEEYLDGSVPIPVGDAPESAPVAASGAGADMQPGSAAAKRSASQIRMELERLQQALISAEAELEAAQADGDEGGAEAVGLKGDRPTSDYYEGYGDFGIHAEMLQDRARTLAYKAAFDNLGASGWLKGKSILDVGCGTGVLAMFGLKAGAERAVGVDSSRTVHDAIAVSMVNGFGDGGSGPLRLIRSRLEDMSTEDLAPLRGDGAQAEGGVDVLVSEWMGYGLLFESMLTSVLVARDRFLRPGGVLMPDSATIFVEGLGDPSYYEKHVGFWGDVYGLDMGGLAGRSAERPHVGVMPEASAGTDRAVAQRFDLLAVRDSELDFVATVQLRRLKERTFAAKPSPTALPSAVSSAAEEGPSPNDVIFGIVVSFDTGFDARPFAGPPGPVAADASAGKAASGAGAVGAASIAASSGPEGYEPVNLSTRPDETPTHWAQTVLWLKEPLEWSEAGSDVIDVKLTMTRLPDRPRSYKIAAAVMPAGGSGDAPLREQEWLLD